MDHDPRYRIRDVNTTGQPGGAGVHQLVLPKTNAEDRRELQQYFGRDLVREVMI